MKIKSILLLVLIQILFTVYVKGQEAEKSSGMDQVIDQMDFRDTDIRDIIRSIATKYELNILIDNSITERLSLHFTNVRVQDVIEFIVQDNGYRLQQNGNIYKILPPEPPPVIVKKIEVAYDKGLLSVNLENDELEKSIRAIAASTGKTILINQAATGRLSGLLQSVPFEEGLKQLLENNGFLLKKDAGIYTVQRDLYSYQKFDSPTGKGAGPLFLNIEDSLVSLDVRDAPIKNVVQEAAHRLDENIFIYGNLEGNIDARASRLSFFELLNLMFQGTDYSYKVSDGVILIGNKSVKGIATSELIKLNYLKADKLQELLPKEIMSQADMTTVIEQNGIMVIGTHGTINDLRHYISQIDRPSPQILIETLVIDINDSKIRDITMEAGYGNPEIGDTSSSRLDFILPGFDLLLNSRDLNRIIDDAGNLFGISKIGTLPADFFLKVKALETKGILQVRSRPQIATLNGYPADISIGTTQYYKLITRTPYRDPSQIYLSETEQFQTIEAKISLQIIPWVSGSGEITVEIHPEFSTPVGQLSPNVPPTIQSRTLNSTVRLKDGETIVLGGLVQQKVEETHSGIPLLSRLPVIGNLMKNQSVNNSQNELIIYVTPHLYYGDEEG